MSKPKNNQPKTHWNCRVMAHEYTGPVKRHVGTITLMIHEVHYKNGKPVMYATEPTNVRGDTLKELADYIDKLIAAGLKPILWHGARFPEEYKPKPI